MRVASEAPHGGFTPPALSRSTLPESLRRMPSPGALFRRANSASELLALAAPALALAPPATALQSRSRPQVSTRLAGGGGSPRAPPSPRRNMATRGGVATAMQGPIEIAQRDAIARATPFAYRQCNHCSGLCLNPRDFGAGVFCSGECAISFAMLKSDPLLAPQPQRRSDTNAQRWRARSDEILASSSGDRGWHGVGSHESGQTTPRNSSEDGSPDTRRAGRAGSELLA